MPTTPQRVRDVMATSVATVGPSYSVLEAVQIMVTRDISGLPVVDANGGVIGMLTERDLIEAALQGGYFDDPTDTVAGCMAQPVHCVGPDDPLMDVAQLFARAPYRRCPVVADGVLVGLICRRQVLNSLLGGQWFTAPTPEDS